MSAPLSIHPHILLAPGAPARGVAAELLTEHRLVEELPVDLGERPGRIGPRSLEGKCLAPPGKGCHNSRTMDARANLAFPERWLSGR